MDGSPNPNSSRHPVIHLSSRSIRAYRPKGIIGVAPGVQALEDEPIPFIRQDDFIHIKQRFLRVVVSKTPVETFLQLRREHGTVVIDSFFQEAILFIYRSHPELIVYHMPTSSLIDIREYVYREFRLSDVYPIKVLSGFLFMHYFLLYFCKSCPPDVNMLLRQLMSQTILKSNPASNTEEFCLSFSLNSILKGGSIKNGEASPEVLEVVYNVIFKDLYVESTYSTDEIAAALRDLYEALRNKGHLAYIPRIGI